MSAVNDRHAFNRDVEALLSFTQTTVSDAHTKILNLLNRAYAQGYRDADPENHRQVAVSDGSEIIMDGAGRVVAHIPPRVILDGTVSGRFRTYVQGGHLVIWDNERSETIGLIEMNDRVAFNIHRADGTMPGQSPEDQQLDQVAEEIRARWAASRAAVPPHYIVCLPHDFVDKLKRRMAPIIVQADEQSVTSLAEAVSSGVQDILLMVVNQLDAWTEWDSQKGWR